VGCGYPGDSTTRKWLANNVDSVFGFPSIVRFSWKTSHVMLTDQGKKANWHDIPESVQNGFNKAEINKMLVLQK
jgi:ribonuclease H2 subunit A